MNQDPLKAALPYEDTKPVGAADFYLAINATFRFIESRMGQEGLLRYWNDLGTGYYAPVSSAWKQGGLPAVAEYWKTFFAAEPGADVEVSAAHDEVRVDVRVCPAIRHLREHGRKIVPGFCQHCYYVSEAMGKPVGITVRLNGGNGACQQTFRKDRAENPPQDLAAILEAK